MMEIIKILTPKRDLIHLALLKVKKHILKNGDDLALKILESQLTWLLDVIEKEKGDIAKLKKVNLGQLAVREIETLDFSLAEDLYDIQETLEALKKS